MKRSLAVLALAAIICNHAAASGLMYVKHNMLAGQAQAGESAKQSVERDDRIYLQLLSLLGVNVTVVDARAAKAEFGRVGAMTWNFGRAGAYAQSFDAVLYSSVVIGSSFGGATTIRADSMLRTDYGDDTGPRVPQLFAMNDGNILNGGGDVYKDALCCSSGIAVGPVDASTNNKNPTIYDPRSGDRWETSGSFQAYVAVNSTRPAGGFRDLLTSAGWNRLQVTADGYAQCQWCDSLFLASADSVILWERPFGHIPGAKPVVFVWPEGVGSVQDSFSDNSILNRASEFDVTVAMCALARLDSLTGNVLFDKNKLPLVRGITVEGLCSRNRRRAAPHGINPADTAFFYATIDSLAALRPPIPIVFGVNADPDSMTAYKRDLIVVAGKLPLAQFTPVVYSGIYDTSAAGLLALNGAGTKYHRPRDVWGRYRARTAYGDGSCAGKDSSLYCSLYGAKWVLDSVLTSLGYANRMSKFAIAPDDDWSPKTMAPYGGGPTLDSVFWAVRRAGFTGIRVNGADMRANGPNRSISGTNPWGYYNKQRKLRENVGGGEITLLAHSGGPIIGSHAWVATFNDTVGAVFDSGAVGIPSHEMSRVWAGFTQDRDGILGDGDAWTNDFNQLAGGGSISAFTQYADVSFRKYDHGEAPKKGYVIALCANDLSGFSGGLFGPGARNGYWIIKQAHTAMNAINRFDGRTVMRFGYPEEIRLP